MRLPPVIGRAGHPETATRTLLPSPAAPTCTAQHRSRSCLVFPKDFPGLPFFRFVTGSRAPENLYICAAAGSLEREKKESRRRLASQACDKLRQSVSDSYIASGGYSFTTLTKSQRRKPYMFHFARAGHLRFF